MHYKYYYYSREELLAKEENANQRHLVTIACDALLMTTVMSAICKHIQKLTHAQNIYAQTEHTRIHTNARTHARERAHTHTHTNTRMHMHPHTHASTQTHKHACTYTHTINVRKQQTHHTDIAIRLNLYIA